MSKGTLRNMESVVGHDEPAALLQERKVLALEALSHLAEQFATNPDLQSLMESVALTVAGQFAVTSAMIVTKGNSLNETRYIQAATGKFRNYPIRCDLLQDSSTLINSPSHPGPVNIGDLVTSDPESTVVVELREMGVQILIPIVVDGTTIGIMLLGPRVGNLQFTEVTMQLLQHIVATITPLVANSLLYDEMAAMSARHRHVLDSVLQAIFVFDSQGTLVMANRSATALAAGSLNQEYGNLNTGLQLEDLFPDRYFPGWAEKLRNLLRGTIQRLPSSMIAKIQDSERVFGVSVRPRVELSAIEEGMILTLNDKTEETSNEHRMFELEKFAERGLMASSIAHELNNHLGMILGGIELAIAAGERGNQEKVSSTMAKLRESVSRMQRFTAGLMDYARMNAQKELIHINDLVSDVISFATCQKRFGSVSLDTHLSPDLAELLVDRDQIAQEIINVLNNAADAISETDRRDGIIIVSTAQSGEELVLTVSDNGRGMPPATKEKLFKTHLTTKPKGHGYGLTTCAKILEQHEAKVSVESRVGFGTTFEFRFPTTR